MRDSPADPRLNALIASMRRRFAEAQARGDEETKQALFREAAYLNLPPEQLVNGSGGVALS
jgi:hypothetical protein